MFHFTNDYSVLCHPRILEELRRVNLEFNPGYGGDGHCAAAAAEIREQAGCPGAAVHFLCGGTQTNLTAIAAFLRPHQCVLAAGSGHINVHETGAIEAAGHKVVTRPAPLGKLTVALISQMLDEHTDEHMVKPGLVYLSQSTELGAVYSLKELEDISRLCRERGLTLYVDGARLSCALAACDVTLPDLARLCDAFYLGGTKNGALLGEALVIVNPELQTDFRYILKQRGGMLAKGWLVGIQFEQLLRDGLYWELGRQANRTAQLLCRGLEERGIPMLHPSPTNQIFPILTPKQWERFGQVCTFENWGKREDGGRVVRLVTSWCTRQEEIEGFLREVDG